MPCLEGEVEDQLPNEVAATPAYLFQHIDI
jgi:hypothetical protein